VADVVVVVVGPWLVVIPAMSGGIVSGQLLYTVDPRWWPITWVFEVLPLFFFVGGFANYVSYHAQTDAGRRRHSFHARRFNRLLRPTLVFLGLWVAIEALLHIDRRPCGRAR